MLQKLINNFILTFPKVVQNLLIKIAVVWQVERKNRTCKLALNRFYFLFEMISWFFTLIYFWNVFTLTKGPIFEGALGFEISGRDGHSRDLFKAGFNISFFFKNGPTPASFLFIFGPFKQTIFTANQCEKMSCPSSIRRRDLNPWPLELESPPITTRPGLPPKNQFLKTRRIKESTDFPDLENECKNFKIDFNLNVTL